MAQATLGKTGTVYGESEWAAPAYDEHEFPALRLVRSSRFAKHLSKWLLGAMVVGLVAMVFAPWQQSIRGEGAVTEFLPVNRPQPLQAPVKGVIAEIGEGIYENARIKEGQLIYRIADQDPEYLNRLSAQVSNAEDQVKAAKSRLESALEQLAANERVVYAKTDELESTEYAKREALAAADAFVSMAENKLQAQRDALSAAEAVVWQAELDFKRKERLASKGLETGLKFQESELKYREAKAKEQMAEQYVESAIREVEGKKAERSEKLQEYDVKINKAESELEKAKSDLSKVRIDIAKTQEEISKTENDLLKLRTDQARQRTQEVRAPRDGYIMQLVAYDRSGIVKAGEDLCVIVPDTKQPAVQMWVSGNDAPLIAPGRPVRLQFEGWPAVQFSGWPSVAVGTFGGKVALVDPTDNGKGQFRILVVPDENDDPWPQYPYLRQGVRANGWVLLDQVALGYEVWRRLNGFPQALKSQGEQLKDAKQAKPPKPAI
jgi:multidrug resistance efflux pump